MKNSNILVVCNYLLQPSRIGGMDRFYWTFDKVVKDSGFSITWFFPQGSIFTDLKYDQLGIEIAKSPCFEDACSQYLKELNEIPFVIITHFVPFFSKYNKLWKTFGVNKIVAVDHMSRPRLGYSLSQKVKLAIRGVVFRSDIDGIISVSNFVYKRARTEFLSILPMFPKHIIVCNGVDTELFLEGTIKSNQSNRLVMIGHLMEDKGFQVLIRALGKLKKEYNEELFSCDIIGGGNYRQDLEALVEYEGLKKITFLGEINNAHELLRNYDACVLPSLWQENFPFTIIESFASGLPVFASQTGGVPEMVKDGRGWLFERGNDEQLKELLKMFLSLSMFELEVIRQGCRDYANNVLNLKNMVNGHWEFIKNIISM